MRLKPLANPLHGILKRCETPLLPGERAKACFHKPRTPKFWLCMLLREADQNGHEFAISQNEPPLRIIKCASAYPDGLPSQVGHLSGHLPVCVCDLEQVEAVKPHARV
jgi:hypothetical protein